MSDFIRNAFPRPYGTIANRRLTDSAVEEACADYEHLSRMLAEAGSGNRMLSAGLLADIEASLADLHAEIERRIAISAPSHADLGLDDHDMSEQSDRGEPIK